MRIINKSSLNMDDYVLPIEKGGTGSRSLAEAAAALGMITQDMVGKEGGLFLMPEGGIGKEHLEASVSDPSVPLLNGPTEVAVGGEAVFRIVNYDSFTTYLLQANNGTAVRDGERVIFTAGTQGEASLMVNSTRVMLAVGTGFVRKPSVSVYGALGDLIFEGSSFSVAGGVADTHIASDWQVATDSGFMNIVAQSLDDSVNLTQWSVQEMDLNATYYVRVRYKGAQAGVSDWSDPVSFSTQEGGLEETAI